MGLKCQVVLENSTKIFYPGEVIKGSIVIVNDKNRDVRGLQLKFRGESFVTYTEKAWTKGINGKFNCRVVTHKAEEVYFYQVLNVFGNDGLDTEIVAGTLEYPFEYQLPNCLPSSFKGKCGGVIYDITAILPRSWAFDSKASTAFHIIGLLNLDEEPFSVQQSILQRSIRNSLCCFSYEVTFVLKLLRGGVIVGEMLPFLLEINNPTRHAVQGKFTISQEITFYAESNQRTVRNIICVFEGPSVPRKSDLLWKNDLLQVPLLPPSHLGSGCNLIDIWYELEFSLHGPGLSSSMTVRTPLIIGNLNLSDKDQGPYGQVSSKDDGKKVDSSI